MTEPTQNDQPKKIVSARITDLPKKFGDPMPKVYVKYEGEEKEDFLFEYYPDEISFTSGEFIGKTAEEARKLKYDKDLAYLRS